MTRCTNVTRKAKRRSAIAAVAAMLVGLTTACGGGGDESSDGTVKMRLATSLVESLPFMTILQVAKDKGWFEDEGIDFEIISASGGGDTAQALSSGAADMAITGPDAVLNLVEKSEGSIINVGPWMNYNIVQWMAADSSVSLQGAKLGITGAGSTGEMIGKAVIAAEPDKDIKLVVAGGLGAQWAAAKSGKISGAYSATPASTSLEHDEGAVVLVSARDVIGDIPMDLVAADKSYAEDHPDAVKGFWKVIDKGYSYIRDNPESAATDLNKIIKMDQEVLLTALKQELESPLSYSIKVDCDALYNMSNVMIKGGVITDPVDWTKAMDQQYLPSEDRADCSGS